MCSITNSGKVIPRGFTLRIRREQCPSWRGEGINLTIRQSSDQKAKRRRLCGWLIPESDPTLLQARVTSFSSNTDPMSRIWSPGLFWILTVLTAGSLTVISGGWLGFHWIVSSSSTTNDFIRSVCATGFLGIFFKPFWIILWMVALDICDEGLVTSLKLVAPIYNIYI